MGLTRKCSFLEDSRILICSLSVGAPLERAYSVSESIHILSRLECLVRREYSMYTIIMST